MNVRQFDLFDPSIVDRRPASKVNARVTLKQMPGREWIVSRRYQTVLDNAEINTRWKVGGL